jgi:hypothetical protein
LICDLNPIVELVDHPWIEPGLDLLCLDYCRTTQSLDYCQQLLSESWILAGQDLLEYLFLFYFTLSPPLFIFLLTCVPPFLGWDSNLSPNRPSVRAFYQSQDNIRNTVISNLETQVEATLYLKESPFNSRGAKH